VLPSAKTAAMLFWALLASGQITMHKVDGWQSLAERPSDPSGPYSRAMLCAIIRTPALAAAKCAKPGLPPRLAEAPVKMILPWPRVASRRAASRPTRNPPKRPSWKSPFPPGNAAAIALYRGIGTRGADCHMRGAGAVEPRGLMFMLAQDSDRAEC
jgi:hypothetical protein